MWKKRLAVLARVPLMTGIAMAASAASAYADPGCIPLHIQAFDLTPRQAQSQFHIGEDLGDGVSFFAQQSHDACFP